jgi:hypothetical protein
MAVGWHEGETSHSQRAVGACEVYPLGSTLPPFSAPSLFRVTSPTFRKNPKVFIRIKSASFGHKSKRFDGVDGEHARLQIGDVGSSPTRITRAPGRRRGRSSIVSPCGERAPDFFYCFQFFPFNVGLVQEQQMGKSPESKEAANE